MKKATLFLLAILLLTTASALTVEETAVNNVIIYEYSQPAKFELLITGAQQGTYNLYTLTDVSLLPRNSFQLNSETNKIEVFIYPTESLTVRGHYTFSYFLNNAEGENYQKSLTVKIVNLKDAIEINSDSNDPDSNEITFYVRNLENAKLEEIEAKFSSVFFDEFEYVFNLEPYEIHKFSIPLNKEKTKTISAGAYIINAEFKTDKGQQKIEGKIYLGEKKGVDTQDDASGLLVRTNTVTKINIGNIGETVTVRIRRDIFTRLFTSFNIEPDLVDRDDFMITYSWTRTLKPAEILTIKARTNYILPIMIIILLILIIFGIKRYVQNIVEVKKSVSPVRTKGGEFALKVKLNLKARREVENLTLVDTVPAIVKIYEKFGTAQPDSIDAKNRRLRWNLGNLAKGEERAFSYLVYSKVGIVGKFSLPSARAVFEKNNLIHEVESNKVFFLSEQTSKDE